LAADAEHPVSPADFAALLQRAAHDREAQEQLCQHYAPQVRIVARVLLGPALRPHFDSLDLVQSVHRSLLMGLQSDKFDISSPEKLIALATTMVRRKVARKWRRSRRQISAGSPNLPTLADTLSSLSSTEADPAAAAEFNDQLQRLCENLSETERRMLELRLEGYTSGEVAQRLGLHAVALRVRCTRLRKRLQDSGVVADWL
jgi:RNA polymerase sigma factor (sigma-70 family)